MGHLFRVAVAIVAIIAIGVLGIVLDGAVDPLIHVAYDHGVDEGPFSPVLTHADNVRWLFVPGMILGIVLWLVYGTVRQERREEVRRRVGPP